MPADYPKSNELYFEEEKGKNKNISRCFAKFILLKILYKPRLSTFFGNFVFFLLVEIVGEVRKKIDALFELTQGSN